MELEISKPYIALNEETYISLRHQELHSCKHTSYDFYCEEPFVVKPMSRYSCKAAFLSDIPKLVIKDLCNFKYYYNNTSNKPTVLDGGDEIIVSNWLNKISLKCTISNDIYIKPPDYSFILVNRTICYNCELEAEECFLLDSLTGCS